MITCKSCGHESGWDIDRGDVNPEDAFYELPGPVIAKRGGIWEESVKIELKMCPVCNSIFAVREW